MPIVAPPPEIQIVQHLDDAASGAAGISAEMLAASRPSSVAAMINALVAREAYVGWSRREFSSTASRPVAVTAYHDPRTGQSDGFYYRPDQPADLPPQVCRVRTGTDFANPERYVAIRWCHARLGVELPPTPPPPVGDLRVQ